MEAGENGTGEEVGLLVLEAKSLRPFKTKDEYLYAMKEDLAEWFKCLYEDIFITAENFLEVLETGVLLCQHANEVRKFVAEQKEKGDFEMKSNFVRNITIPQYDVQFRIDVKPETFLARDNVSNFITWTVKMGIPEVLRFETDDLVMRKNERSVVLCLLEVARVGAKFGMLAPTIVQMEEEIDAEIATGEPPPQIKTCDVKSLDEMVRELVGRCTCPVQFPIIKMGEGKYKIGESKTLVFVRILRKHVMIRVGGGWDTLEHYLDKHDPCQCNFQGHRQVGRGPSTPRRASTAGITQSQPVTPRTPRRQSVTSTVNPPSQHTTQGHTSFRSASPGPNSKKLPLNRSNSQPGSALTSPDGPVKSPNLSSTGTFLGMSKTTVSNVSNVSKSRTSAQSTNSPRSVKNVSTSGPINTRRSASPAPGMRRSESPAPEAINRLRSPSPAPSSTKNTLGTRTQSVPAAIVKRCASPVKQITMSELRSSREGKPGLQMLRRQTSVDSSSDVDNDTSGEKKPSETGIAIDKISTMSLGEFKSLLNSALSVPNTTGSQCSSDSPRSQSSVDSSRNNSMTQNRKPAANKSVHIYKPGGAIRTVSHTEKSNTLPRTKSSSLDCSSSGYSSSSVASDKSAKKTSANSYSPVTNAASTYSRTSVSRPKTPSNDSPRSSQTVATRTNITNKHSVYAGTGLNKTRSQNSISSDTSNKLNNATVPSRSSSQSSFQSYDSINEEEGYDRSDLRSVDSENYLPKYNGEIDSHSEVNKVNNRINNVSPNYTRSNSYTPRVTAVDKAKWAEPRNETRANSEPKEVVKSDSLSNMQPINVGYASFSHQEQNVNSPGILSPTYKFDEELSKIESEPKKYESTNDDICDEINFQEEKPVSKTPSVTSQISARRPSTPSLIPRPATPKINRKLSLTTGDDTNAVVKQTDNRGRPPTPKKSNIIARANTGTSSLKAADSSKEKSYKDIFQSKRSTTPGPGNVSTNAVSDNVRRCTTPGPSLSRTTSLSTTSATVSRDRLNQTLEKNRDAPLSVFDGNNDGGDSVKTKPKSGSTTGVIGRRHSVDSRSFSKQNSSKEPETVIMVNRSGEGHSLTVQEQAKPPTNTSAKRPNVLARARTDDARSRTQTRTNTGISRQRPQSVEPRQLIPRSKNTPDSNEQNVALSVHKGEDGNHSIYNRTQEWVQTAAEQTSKVQKTKVMKQVNPKVRRAMTPNSFHKRIDQEEPRSLDEIKAALTLPINGMNRIEIDTEELDAPPEDPEMYAQMEKLFNELRKQELKKSVNETPGSNVTPAKSSKSKSKSSSSINDEDASLDSNKNIKHKALSLSTSSSVTSPTVQKKTPVNSSVSQPPYGRQPSRGSSTSSVSANPSTSASRSTQPSTPRSTPPRATPPRTVSTPRSDPPRPASPSMNRSAQLQRPASPSMNRTAQPQRPASPSMNRSAQSARPSSPSMNRSAQPARPSSPSMNRSAQPARPSSPSMNRSAQPARPSSPSMNRSAHPPRPASPRTTASSQPAKPPVQRPASPRTTSTTSSRSSIPPSPRSTPDSGVSSSQLSTSPQTPRQPPRPASTPPRPSTPVGRTSSSRARDDSDSSQSNGTVAASSLISKIKEIIKVKPRKDKVEGIKQKSRIPAPKSLASAGKSRSFSNLATTGRSMTLPNTKANGHLDYSGFDGDMNGMDYENDINGGLNVTMSGRNEAPKLKMAMPLTTGRATVIRKESIEKNKNPPRLTRAVSVERNMGGLASDFQFYREGEYV